MELFLIHLVLDLSAVAAGAVNAIAGGGTLLTFPALMSVLGSNGVLAGVLANGTSTFALMPGSLASAWGYRKEVAPARRIMLWLLIPSIIGGIVGALLVTELPASIFDALVPWLILTATVLFLLQGPIKRLMRTPQGPPTGRTIIIILLAQLVIAVYGGYFGAGIGILMLSALGFMVGGDIHRINGVKTVLAFTINAMSVVVFVVKGMVVWKYALTMMVAAIIGGYLGARLARRLPPSYVRICVIVIGLTLSAYYFGKQLL
jgi:uncharacterized membrane protein YfcA